MSKPHDSVERRLEGLTSKSKPKKPTVKALIFAKLDVIESALANGWSYDDIALRLTEKHDTDTGIEVTVSTLRKYVYLARIQEKDSEHGHD